MWQFDFDETYFRIFDSAKLIAGYFDPDYGDLFPKENEEKIISEMIKNKEKIKGGFLMVPLVKFGLFNSDLETSIDILDEKISSVKTRLNKWRDFLKNKERHTHVIRISHTDQDMLTITFPLIFSEPVALDKKELALEVGPILDHLQKLGLL